VTPTAPARVLVVGGGGREHALAWKLAGEPGIVEVVVAPGSAGIALEERVRCVAGVDPLDPGAVVAAARAAGADLVVVGPEAPLVAGVADACRATGVAVFGPDRAAARIEGSKAFCREIAAAAGVPIARGAAFEDAGAAIAFAEALDDDGAGVVVKADGLAAGKGVTVCHAIQEARSAIRAALAGAGTRVVVEERLDGREASVIALCDGRDAVALPAARDHKRLSDGDAGPNTGGMGAFSPLDDLPDAEAAAIVARFHRPILAELARRGSPFVGALYAGLMLTTRGPVLLECNARFGDPEAQVLLPRLDVPLGALLLACARRELAAALVALGITGDVLPADAGAAVGVVLAAAGYPGTPRRGDRIDGVAAAAASGALVFQAGTARDADGTWRTAGGRILTVVGRGQDLASARARAEAAADAVRFEGMQRRHDIGLAGAAAPVGAGTASGGRA